VQGGSGGWARNGVQAPPNLTVPHLREEGKVATTLDSAQKRLQEAQATAKKRATRENVGPDWPTVDGITLEDALEELTLDMLLHGARVSFGVTDGSADLWCRVSFPVECDHSHAGMVAFTTSTTMERALRKAAQLLPETVKKVWQPDKFAR
jgi:hypothetical protein